MIKLYLNVILFSLQRLMGLPWIMLNLFLKKVSKLLIWDADFRINVHYQDIKYSVLEQNHNLYDEHTVLETVVAIKSLHSDLVSDEDFRKRFRTEARTQSRLSHPNIVKLIDFQEREDGLFLIMEYVEGKQLNDYIRDVSG